MLKKELLLRKRADLLVLSAINSFLLLALSGCAGVGQLKQQLPTSWEMNQSINSVINSISSPEEAVSRINNRLQKKNTSMLGSSSGLDSIYICDSDGRQRTNIVSTSGKLILAGSKSFVVECTNSYSTTHKSYNRNMSYGSGKFNLSFKNSSSIIDMTAARIRIGKGYFLIKDKERAIEVYGLFKYLHDLSVNGCVNKNASGYWKEQGAAFPDTPSFKWSYGYNANRC